MNNFFKIFLLSMIASLMMVACSPPSTVNITDDLKSLIENNDNPRLIDQEFRTPSHNQFISFPIRNEALSAIELDEDLKEGVAARIYTEGTLAINPNFVTNFPDVDGGEVSDATLAAILSEYSVDGFDFVIVRAETQNCMSCKYRYDLKEGTREQLTDYKFGE